MAVPSASWPHAVFPGLSGNKGRKTPFYSITPAALGHWANTKESGFIKTISARNEPYRLIYHRPCEDWEDTNADVQEVVECFPNPMDEADGLLFYNTPQLPTCAWLVVHVFLNRGWLDLKKVDSTSRIDLEGIVQLWQQSANLWSYFLSKPRTPRNHQESVGNINDMPARLWGFGGGLTSGGGGQNEREGR